MKSLKRDATAKQPEVSSPSVTFLSIGYFVVVVCDRRAAEYLSMSREDAASADVPLMFVSFPSAKDSSWEERYPGSLARVD